MYRISRSSGRIGLIPLLVVGSVILSLFFIYQLIVYLADSPADTPPINPTPETGRINISPIPTVTPEPTSIQTTSTPIPTSPDTQNSVTETPPSAQKFCTSDGDCTPSCAYGCVNAAWLSGKPDCLAEPYYTCECVRNTCVTQ